MKWGKCSVRRIPKGAWDQLQVREQLFYSEKRVIFELGKSLDKPILKDHSRQEHSTGAQKDKESLRKFRRLL